MCDWDLHTPLNNQGTIITCVKEWVVYVCRKPSFVKHVIPTIDCFISIHYVFVVNQGIVNIVKFLLVRKIIYLADVCRRPNANIRKVLQKSKQK